jgi:hypothetical protein
MKKLILFINLLSAGLFVNAQTTLLDETFESYTDFAITGFGAWQTLDLDGLDTYTGGGPVVGGSTTWTANWTNAGGPMAFQIFNLSTSNATNNATAITGVDEEVRNFSPHAGQKCAVSWAGVPAGGVNANNDWLISPPITLGASNNQLSLWVKALSPAYTEKYKIGVYVGSGTPTSAANFTFIPNTTAINATTTWTQVTRNLDAYANQTVRIGIQYMAADQYMFLVDDIKITTGTLATNEVGAKSKLAQLYPNPTKGEINIKSDKKIKSSEILDFTGKSVLKSSSAKVDISSLPKGNYIMQVEFTDGTSISEKIIKE